MIFIGRGHVHHSRKEHNRNGFRYPSFFLFFRTDRAGELPQNPILSFRHGDYLGMTGGTLDGNIREFLRRKLHYETKGEIWLHTMPRMFGYAFNPVSFWLCRRDGNLDAVLVEVNNTFGEKHFYWIKPPEPLSAEQWYRAEKAFHVSPFFPVDGYYEFRFRTATEDVRIDINYHAPSGGLRLATWVVGRLSPSKNVSTLGLVLGYGWMTPMVVGRIHFQAVKLWLKKTKFYRKPEPPNQKVTS